MTKHAARWPLLVLVDLLFASVPVYGQQKRVIPGTKDLPYSDGIVVGNALYIAGQAGDENGKLRAGSIGPTNTGSFGEPG